MDFGYMFTSFDGRISRKPYWIGVIVLVVIMIAVTIVMGFIVGFDTTAYKVVTLLLSLAFLYPGGALVVKRLHDRNRPTWWAIIAFAPSIISNITNALGMTGDPLNPNGLDYLMYTVLLVVGIWMFIELGCLRGTVGPNQYGPDPLEARV